MISPEVFVFNNFEFSTSAKTCIAAGICLGLVDAENTKLYLARLSLLKVALQQRLKIIDAIQFLLVE